MASQVAGRQVLEFPSFRGAARGTPSADSSGDAAAPTPLSRAALLVDISLLWAFSAPPMALPTFTHAVTHAERAPGMNLNTAFL